jgi:hypothetical protein
MMGPVLDAVKEGSSALGWRYDGNSCSFRRSAVRTYKLAMMDTNAEGGVFQ